MNRFAAAFDSDDEEEVMVTTPAFTQPDPSFDRWTALWAAIDAVNNGSFVVDMWHPAELCTGVNCRQHPLLNNSLTLAVFRAIEIDGKSWGTLLCEEEAERLAAETPAQRAERLQREAAQAAQQQVESEIIKQESYLREVEFRHQLKHRKGQHGVQKIQQPCKWLYAIPGRDGVFSNSCCAECWAHEYTDAGGRFKAPRKCEYLHPNEPGWLAEWNSLPVTRDKWRAPKPLPAPLAGRVAAGAPAKGVTVYMSSAPRPSGVKRPQLDSAW